MSLPDSNIYDVIIAGSGPAGASAAYGLAKAGKKILVLEKEKLPRYKTCGGGLTFKGLNLIPFDISEIIERNCFNALINDYEAGVSIVTKRKEPLVTMTMRSKLDYYLINKAKESGAGVKDEVEVKEIFDSNDNVVVVLKNSKEKFFSRFFIAADGAVSLAAKKYFGDTKKKLIPALEYEVYVDDETLSGFTNAARFDFGVVPNGYGWVFPKKDHLSVGVLSIKLKNNNLNNSFAKYLELLNIKKINYSERHGFVIPILTRNIYAKGRILLTGDAAGFTDPITAEGISFAILSGQLAAESIIKKSLLPESVCKEYNFKISKDILPELKAGKILSFFIYNNNMLRSWIIKLYGAKLSELITDVIMGEIQ